VSSTGTELPDLGRIIGPFLQRVAQEQRPLLIAVAERMAADRYRAWAREVTDPPRSARLLACADREEEIARRVEALYPEAASVQRDILASNPDLEDLNRSLFAGRPLDQQFAIQARGERLGAATWRAFAHDEKNPAAHDTFLGCAGLEEESAAVLEAFLEGKA
jgi:hypothetical protein